jgi:hypothetical protein
MTDDQLDAIEAAAKAATPGKRNFSTEPTVIDDETDPDPNVPDRWWTWELSACHEALLGGTELEDPAEDLTFIATANPETVLALVALARRGQRIEEAAREVADVLRKLNNPRNFIWHDCKGPSCLLCMALPDAFADFEAALAEEPPGEDEC